jgi:hypothetical protein
MYTHRVLLAAALALGLAGTANLAWSQDAIPETGYRAAPTTQPEGSYIREVFREVTNAAMTRGGFDDIVERFANADRDRFNKDPFTGQDHATLDGRIAQIQKAWQSKYGAEFNLKDATNIFSETFVMVRTGPADGPRLAAGTDQPTATATISESHGLPAVNVPFVRETLNRWKIDVPNTYTSQQLHDNLLKQLTMLGDRADKWPADANEAYRAFGHHVFLAVTNAQATGDNQMPSDRTNQKDTAPFPKPDAARP